MRVSHNPKIPRQQVTGKLVSNLHKKPMITWWCQQPCIWAPYQDNPFRAHVLWNQPWLAQSDKSQLIFRNLVPYDVFLMVSYKHWYFDSHLGLVAVINVLAAQWIRLGQVMLRHKLLLCYAQLSEHGIAAWVMEQSKANVLRRSKKTTVEGCGGAIFLSVVSAKTGRTLWQSTHGNSSLAPGVGLRHYQSDPHNYHIPPEYTNQARRKWCVTV